MFWYCFNPYSAASCYIFIIYSISIPSCPQFEFHQQDLFNFPFPSNKFCWWFVLIFRFPWIIIFPRHLYLSIWKEITTTLKIIQPQKNIYGEKSAINFFLGKFPFFFISVISTRPSHIKYTFTFWNKVFQWQCCGCQNVKTFRQKHFVQINVRFGFYY